MFVKKFVKSLGTSWLKLKMVIRFEADQKLFRENGEIIVEIYRCGGG